jgi:hypothetical protein
MSYNLLEEEEGHYRILRINNDYFLKQHWLTDHYHRNALCFLWGNKSFLNII